MAKQVSLNASRPTKKSSEWLHFSVRQDDTNAHRLNERVIKAFASVLDVEVSISKRGIGLRGEPSNVDKSIDVVDSILDGDSVYGFGILGLGFPRQKRGRAKFTLFSPVCAAHASSVIGKGGSRVRHLRRKYRVSIWYQTDESRFILTSHNENNCRAAEKAIREIVDRLVSRSPTELAESATSSSSA